MSPPDPLAPARSVAAPAITLPLMDFLFSEVAAKVRAYWAMAPAEELRR